MTTIPPTNETKKPRVKRTKEFKERAVALALRSDVGFAKAAKDLGINQSLLRTWAQKSITQGPEAFRDLPPLLWTGGLAGAGDL